MILDLVGFISTHFQPKRSHGDPFQTIFQNISFHFSLEVSNSNLFFDFLAGILSGLDPSKKMRDVRTIHFHPFSRRELRHASENWFFRC